MLQLRNITKYYEIGDSRVRALNGVSIDFRESEFVSILGPSGCGKTTLLNIIGGLDRYSDGDLLINGKSTEHFKDRDWDTYRNHSVGFVFQSYNLIPHQTVLANVELALTLTGVSKAERRRRATEALEKVGLGDQLKKKPNQMSGGQMQRVAIARAIVNDPDILLADEPTGALDTATSVQIMEILKEIARDKLVIMVTHNPELAEQYSTRIVKLRDGRILDDSMPYEAPKAPDAVVRKTSVQKGKKTSMSFWTAFTLSLNNLMTKKGRTFMTSFAGSIGIIGIALILALSNGINAFIGTVQEDTLSSFPLTIQQVTQDYQSLLSSMMEVRGDSSDEDFDDGKIYVDDSLGTMMQAMSATVQNDMVRFKKYIDEHYDEVEPYLTAIRYTYNFDLQIYTGDGKTQVNPTTIFNYMGDAFSGMSDLMSMTGMGSSFGVMSEMIDNQELLEQQYELVGADSHWPESPNEVVLVVGQNNQISKMTLYMLGVLDMDELEEVIQDLMLNGEYESSHMEEYDLNDFLGMQFYMLNTSDFFAKTEGSGAGYTVDGVEYPTWHDIRKLPNWENEQAEFVTENGTALTISGIIRPREGVSATSISGAIGYTKGLTDLILQMNTESEVIAQQKATPLNNILNGESFERIPYTAENIDQLMAKVGSANMATFYSYMTAMIRSSEEYASMLEVNETTFPMFIATMDADKQAALITDMLAEAGENSAAPMALPALFTAVKSIPGGLSSIDFTVENLPDLLPLMSMEQIMVLVSGVPQSEQMPFAISGLAALCEQEYITAIQATMKESLTNWSMDDKTFALLMPAIEQADANRPEDEKLFPLIEQALYDMVPDKDATYDSILQELGDAELAAPASVNFYAKDFASKDALKDFIEAYNETAEKETEKVKYADTVGVLMSSVTTIINAISYVLIAFVSISLVVSSIMIGIITYISVLERTKEIGILRAMGASKKDISRVFNAETLIIGLCAGIIGIVSTVLICIPASAIIQHLTGIPSIRASLPWLGGLLLVVVSTALTVISGLIPARTASRKDPVVALRTE